MEKNKHYYTYRIILTAKDSELYNHWYRGARITTKDPKEDYYKGSSAVINKLKYWDIYPLEYIKTDIVEYDTPEEMYEAEYKLISESYKKDPLCLNKMPGGLGGNVLKKCGKYTEEEIFKRYKKTGQSNKGRKHILKHPEITHERLSKLHKDKIVTEETRKKMSASKVGKKRIKENYKDYDGYIKKLKASLTGKKRSDEHSYKLKIALTKFWKDNEDAKKKMSESVKKALNKPEIKEKLRAGGLHTKGLLWITNDIISKRMSKELAEEYIKKYPEFKYGRIYKK